MQMHCERFSKYKKLMIIQVVFGSLLYLVLIANQLTNTHDGLWHGNYSLAKRWELSIGRWFWLYIDRLRLGISAEPTTSILTLIIISIGNLYIIDIFDMIENKLSYLVCMLILSSTTVCNWLSYRYMSPVFASSYILSIFAAWVLIKKVTGKNKKVELLWCGLAAFAIALCLGAYQANLACTCVLILLYIFLSILRTQNVGCKILYIFYHLSVSFASVGLGCLLYKGIWDIHMKIKNVSASSYNGANNLSIKDMIFSIPKNIWKTYLVTYEYFFELNIKHNIFQQYGIYCIALVLFLAIVLLFFTKVKKIRKSLILLCIIILLLPMACNISLFLATKSEIQIQMTGGMIILFPCLLCVFFLCYRLLCTGGVAVKIHMSLTLLISVAMLYGNIYMVTIDIDAMYEGKNATETMLRNVVIQLQSMDSYSLDKKYLFIGVPSENATFRTTALWNKANSYARYGKFWMKTDCMRYSYNGVLRNMGILLPYNTDAAYNKLIKLQEIKDMPVYPSKGYIQEVEGCIVIKISDTY